MSREHKPFDVSKELATLRHEKKNTTMKKLPTNTTIQRRPLHHAPVASHFAGPQVQKVVYVSARTPLMSAVKRVKKHLSHIEKRAVQSVDATQPSHARFRSELVEASEKLARASEEVLVKASGRAMEQALRIGEWFRVREDEMLCKVEVRTSSVAAIDDIVEVEKGSDDEVDDVDREVEDEATMEETTLTGGETTLEILGRRSERVTETQTSAEGEKSSGTASTEVEKAKRKRRKRRREVYDKDDVPEARIRWVKTVEVAISLRA